MRDTLVVAGIFLRQDQQTKKKQILLFRRGPKESWPGLYEFPGGKVEAGESDKDALARELDEELGIKVEVGDFFASSRWNNGVKWIELRCYLVKSSSEHYQMKNHDAFDWFGEEQILWQQTAPADHDIIRKIFSQS